MKARLLQAARFWLGVAVLLSPLWLAHLVWTLEAPSPRSVATVNYTVPFANYQLHAALHWALDHAKVPPPERTQRWRPHLDYIGYRPDDRANPERLSDRALDSFDTLYLADTYGVYDADLLPDSLRTSTPHLVTSPLRFGGINSADVEALHQHLDAGGDLITEFNVLAPPTVAAASTALQDMLGVSWTGWTGRVFPTLRDRDEVPPWLIERFEEQYPGRGLPDVPSLVLVSEQGSLVVLSDGGFSNVVPSIQITAAGRDRFGRRHAHAPYFGWFALVHATESATTYATFTLPSRLLRVPEWAQAGLDLTFAAVTERTVGRSNRLYFCFDASNMDEVPTAYRLAGLSRMQALLHRRHDVLSTQPAFWQVYVPMVRAFLREPA
jgi:hypothetical protein